MRTQTKLGTQIITSSDLIIFRNIQLKPNSFPSSKALQHHRSRAQLSLLEGAFLCPWDFESIDPSIHPLTAPSLGPLTEPLAHLGQPQGWLHSSEWVQVHRPASFHCPVDLVSNTAGAQQTKLSRLLVKEAVKRLVLAVGTH